MRCRSDFPGKIYNSSVCLGNVCHCSFLPGNVFSSSLDSAGNLLWHVMSKCNSWTAPYNARWNMGSASKGCVTGRWMKYLEPRYCVSSHFLSIHCSTLGICQGIKEVYAIRSLQGESKCFSIVFLVKKRGVDSRSVYEAGEFLLMK